MELMYYLISEYHESGRSAKPFCEEKSRLTKKPLNQGLFCLLHSKAYFTSAAFFNI